MPAVSAPALVLVTGASGFVGTAIIGVLREQGFNVRAVVRDDKKGNYIKDKYPGSEYVIVKDMNAPGAYDHTVKDVDAVVHVASPVDLAFKGDPREMIEPAVAGVVGILKSITDPANEAKVRRFIQLSSIASVGNIRPGPTRYDETDWNDVTVELVAKEGSAADPVDKYTASKTVAEREFWRFFEQNPSVGFDAAAILPGMIFGPPSEYPSANGEITSTVQFILPFAKPGVPDAALSSQFFNAVNVGDVAKAAVLALQTPHAAGQRYILTSEPLYGNDVALVAANVYPERDINKGNSDAAFRAELAKNATVYDGSKAARELGFTYVSRDDTLAETFRAVDAMKK